MSPRNISLSRGGRHLLIACQQGNLVVAAPGRWSVTSLRALFHVFTGGDGLGETNL